VAPGPASVGSGQGIPRIGPRLERRHHGELPRPVHATGLDPVEDLARLVAKGAFREDLFYRLNTVELHLPPLRERRDDIPLLAEFFALRSARRYGRPTKTFGPGALDAIRARPFPGNVRELEHLVEMLTVMVEEEVILPEHLPAPGPADAGPSGPDLPLTAAVARFEKGLLVKAIALSGGIKARAAESLGLNANQMKYLCRKYEL